MKDKNYLYEMYNATSTDDGNGDLETYENWLERQLLARIERLEQLDLQRVTHSSLINNDGSCHTITDGYTTWSKKCTQCKKLSMQVVRVGKVQCCYCG